MSTFCTHKWKMKCTTDGCGWTGEAERASRVRSIVSEHLNEVKGDDEYNLPNLQHEVVATEEHRIYFSYEEPWEANCDIH